MAAPPAAIARLKAGADGGTAGVKAYDDAAASTKASTRDATSALAGDAKGFAGGTNGLEPTLRAQVAAPGGVALANLAALQTAQQTADTVGTAGTSTYLDEAHAAVPVIDAEARLSEAQREAMLAASTQHTVKAPKALSDSQLRTQLLGYAENQRAATAQKAVDRDTRQLAINQAAETNATHQAQSLGHWTDPIPGESSDQANAALLADLAKNKGVLNNAHQQALANIQQQQYGPGITAEAQQAGIGAGIDPNRVAGILGPNVESEYLSNNEKLGLYKQPGLVQNIASDPIQTATQLGYAPHQYRAAAKATYIDWNGPTLSKAVQTWLNGSDPAAAKLLAEGSKASEADIRHAFVAAHPGSHLATNIVSDIIASAHSQITKGMDYGTFANTWLSDPNATEQPDAVKLGLAMVQQLFAYKQAQSRQTALSPTGAAPAS